MNNIKTFGELISESLGGGRDTTRSGGAESFNYSKIVVIDGSLFKLGKDQIDTNNEQFKRAVELLKPLRDSKIEITGSASAVGSDKGFDNNKLALDRAKNFVEALKKSGVDTKNYIIKSKVGKATVANSPEANAEQNVSFKIKEAAEGIRFVRAIDNTATEKKKLIGIKDTKSPEIEDSKYEYMVYKFRYPRGKSNEVYSKISEVKKIGADLENITKEYNQLKNR
jgi:hypothetical protein